MWPGPTEPCEVTDGRRLVVYYSIFTGNVNIVTYFFRNVGDMDTVDVVPRDTPTPYRGIYRRESGYEPTEACSLPDTVPVPAPRGGTTDAGK